MFKKIPLVLVGTGFLFSCSQKLGKTVYGNNRQVKSGYSVSVCTKPAKRYTKAIEANVKASFDSLKGLPQAIFEAGLKQTIVKLSDYTSEGLDFDLLYFRICEFSNSSGLSEEAKTEIIKKSLDIWQSIGLQKAQKNNTIANNNQSGGTFTPISVTNVNQQGGISAAILVAPADKEIPLNENFSINIVNEPEFLKAFPNKFIVEFKPRQGVWYNPYIGYPSEEDSIVHGRYMPKTLGGFMLMNASDFYSEKEIPEKGKINFKVFTGSSTAPANATNGYLLICDKLPTLLILGELNSNKNYLVSKNK